MNGKTYEWNREGIEKRDPIFIKNFCIWKDCISVEKMHSLIHGVQTTQKPPEENKFESLLHTLHLYKLQLDLKFKHKIPSKDIKILSKDMREI